MTNPAAAGAVGIVQIEGDVDDALARLGVAPIAAGGVAVRDLMGVDKGIVARWSASCAHLMPHGGIACVRSVCDALAAAGLTSANPSNPAAWPEARSDVEKRAMSTLARAASPLAVDLLLRQHDLWATPGAASDDERDRVLRRLIEPPLVVAVGPANVGKSTLLNALAGRGVAVVADEPGTTRDHVGAMIIVDGLVVRYVDTPGVRRPGEAPATDLALGLALGLASGIESESGALALEVARRADLLIVCADAASGPPTLPAGLPTGTGRVLVATRTDRGEADFPADARTCVKDDMCVGVDALARVIRERLVPSRLLTAGVPWKFWDESGVC